ncbi:MAG: hypothetical protein HUJ30_05415 [Gammaproteobacteria bacterium]|nr:hypothetical protein [Gammaproteobacteria bacterium]
MRENSEFLAAYKGGFINMLRWHEFDDLLTTLGEQSNSDWFLYAVGEVPPTEPSSVDEIERFLQEIEQLIRNDHDEDYCGIVYSDHRDSPNFVKFYDPNNLGASCGSSGSHVFPGWIMCQMPPEDLKVAFPIPGNRRRWWKKLFG